MKIWDAINDLEARVSRIEAELKKKPVAVKSVKPKKKM